uniref:Protein MITOFERRINLIKE 1, chloroplastic n=1 Tax=Anthurium amnicola TaxID=1678845 RepID=A0A1D1ZJ29_9ARAE
MAKKSPENDKSSIKYRWLPLDLPCLDPADLASGRDSQADRYSHVTCGKKIGTRSSSRVVTTPEFLSAVGRLWKHVSQPLNVSHPKTGVESTGVFQKENGLGQFGSEGANRTSIPLHSDLIFFDPKSVIGFSPSAKSNYDYLKAVKRTILFDPCSESIISSFRGHTEVKELHKAVGSKMMAGARSLGHPDHLVTVYEKISGSPHFKSRVNFADVSFEMLPENCSLEMKTTKTNVSTTHNAKIHVDLSEHRTSLVGDSRESGYMESNVNLADCRCSSEDDAGSKVESAQQSFTSLYDAYSVPPVTNVVEPITVSSCPSFSLYSDYNIEFPSSIYCMYKDSCNMDLESSDESDSKENNAHDSGKNIYYNPVCYKKCPPNLWVSVQNKIEVAFAKGKHGLAGGLAGIFVSLCLHPIDTVKTVIQAHGVDQKPIFHTIESIISERGVMGLYRGIASNIASSAPTSAVYTLTYESVKGALLPLLPVEYHSLAHCTAGGCASIATSFIFTPSERIKQQMQVHSYYQNCWNALIGVLEKGGLPSLYAGWGAVLCRNIPHSIIKFYTYERLKQLLQPSTEPDSHLNTLQTLVCGGIAGSTAALFTTPFDVVKTRLQAQVPGSLKKYDGVIHVLKEIAEHEGIKGLYRGLAPRLLMYVSQGAIFFASYEFLKTVFSFEVSAPRAGGIEEERYTEGDSHEKVT